MRKRSINPLMVVGLEHDSVAANGVACRQLTSNTFTNACDLMSGRRR